MQTSDNKAGRVAAQPGSHADAPSPSVSALPGFDPSRIRRPGAAERLTQFEHALFAIPWIAERVLAGQQFNCYEIASDADDDDISDDDREFSLCIGPITSTRFICDIVGADEAHLVEAALKAATEALREKIACDSDGGGEAGETRSGSTEGDSAGPKGIAQTPTTEFPHAD